MSGQQSKRSRVVLLTGACTNLGSSVALAYARQGARLVLVGWKEEKDKLEKVRAGLSGFALGTSGPACHRPLEKCPCESAASAPLRQLACL